MTTVRTQLFDLEAPGLFEKVLQMGQLVRLERMDRSEGEDSFAEGNLFVGWIEEENIDAPAGTDPDVLLERLWEAYLKEEAKLEALPADYLQDMRSSPGERIATCRLAATSWRPESGHVTMVRVLPSAGPAAFARFVLEFDWSSRDRYVPLAYEMMEGLVWHQEEIRTADIEAQKVQVWSIFDRMPEAQRAAILARYQEILGHIPLPEVPADAEPVAAPFLDLRDVDPAKLDLDYLRSAMPPIASGNYAAEVQVAFLDDPIDVEFDIEFDYELTDGSAGVLRALQGLGPDDRPRAAELAWEHAKICMDATDYGAPAGQSNEDYFGIQGPREALAQLGPGSVYLSERMSGGWHDLFTITFYPPWESEHGCSLVVANGKFVGQTDAGGWLGEFEVT